jgi:spore germination protein KB
VGIAVYIPIRIWLDKDDVLQEVNRKKENDLSTISIEEAARIINVDHMSLLAGSYMKASITLYALNLAITRLLKVQDDGVLILPLAMLGFLLLSVIVKQEANYQKVLLTWPMVTLAASLPVFLLLIVTFVKKRSSISG